MPHRPPSGLGFGLMLVLALAAPAGAVRASEDERSAARCEAAIVNGARRGGVPVQVLHAISLTETGRKTNGRLRPWPWAINREGKGHWFSSQQEALTFARRSLEQGRKSFDVGCVQINYRWHGHAFPSLEDMFNPEWTATYAAQFLRTLYEERGSWSEAAGAYHSLTPELSKIYRKRFDRLLAGLSPDALGDVPVEVVRSRPGPSTLADRRARRLALREQMRAEAALRALNAPPPPPPANGSVGGGMFRPAAGSLLSQGMKLFEEGTPLLNAPAGRMY